jgi:hypothetical protein
MWTLALQGAFLAVPMSPMEGKSHPSTEHQTATQGRLRYFAGSLCPSLLIIVDRALATPPVLNLQRENGLAESIPSANRF